jgi:hypothetical protein
MSKYHAFFEWRRLCKAVETTIRKASVFAKELDKAMEEESPGGTEIISPHD